MLRMTIRKPKPTRQTTGRPRAERPPGLLGEIALRIEGLREAAGWSQPDLARHAGVGAGTIGRLERGAAVPSVETVAAIARAFGLRPRELMAACESW
jgi:XRE family transcriptional regulator, regulator of sulfur utilization